LASRRAGAGEPLSLDAVAARVRPTAAGASPHHDEAAGAVGAHCREALIVRGVGVLLELGTDGNLRKGLAKAGEGEPQCERRGRTSERMDVRMARAGRRVVAIDDAREGGAA
jgi:hypothetical protein